MREIKINSCNKCEANKICDHNRFGFENCNNFIPIIIRCEQCNCFKPYDKVEDFDGSCIVRECETDKTEFCSYAVPRGRH